MSSYKPKTPLVSIVTACYNAKNFIRDLLRSLAQQSYTNWELVIIDDLSTDCSIEVIEAATKEYGLEDKVRLLTQNKNRGYGYTLWNAVKYSKGQLIAVVDADDALYGNKALSITVKTHLKYDDVALTYSNYMECNGKLEPRSVYRTRQIGGHERYIDTKIRINHLKCFKRVYYNATEGINRKLQRTVDKDLVLKLEEVGRLMHIDKALYLYRKHPDNISRTDFKKGKTYQAKIKNDRNQIYVEANKRRQQSNTWLNPSKCLLLQQKWGNYEQFINKPNKKEIIKVIKKVSKSLEAKPSVLDVGCGAGHFMWAITNQVSNLYGLDFSPTMLALTQKQFLLNSDIMPNLTHGSCWELPFKDNFIDIVYQVDVCMHVGGSWKSIVEMIRVAKKFVIFTGPSFEKDLTSQIDKKFENGKRWKISIPLLVSNLDKLKGAGLIKTYELKRRQPTDVYKHKILVIEK